MSEEKKAGLPLAVVLEPDGSTTEVYPDRVVRERYVFVGGADVKDGRGEAVREWLTFEEATALLPEGDRIHVFTQTGIGADWDRESVLSMLRDARIEKSGRMASGMGHGLAAWDTPRHCWLVETREPVAAEPFDG